MNTKYSDLFKSKNTKYPILRQQRFTIYTFFKSNHLLHARIIYLQLLYKVYEGRFVTVDPDLTKLSLEDDLKSLKYSSHYC